MRNCFPHIAFICGGDSPKITYSPHRCWYSVYYCWGLCCVDLNSCCFLIKDRVLFRSKKKNSISCILYDAVMTIRASDHRPVFALFETALRPGRDKWVLEVNNLVDWLINSAYKIPHFSPSLSLDGTQDTCAFSFVKTLHKINPFFKWHYVVRQ